MGRKKTILHGSRCGAGDVGRNGCAHGLPRKGGPEYGGQSGPHDLASRVPFGLGLSEVAQILGAKLEPESWLARSLKVSSGSPLGLTCRRHLKRDDKMEILSGEDATSDSTKFPTRDNMHAHTFRSGQENMPPVPPMI